jgi:hypothetical protein
VVLMAITAVTYCTREDVKSALDIKATARSNAQVDRAVISGAGAVEDQLKRRFYPQDAVRSFDWPNRFQRTSPWKLYFGKNDLVSATAVTAGGVAIPLASINFEPVNSGPPFTRMELDISKAPGAFAVGPTWQHDIAITGTWGYSAVTAPAGTLTAALSDTTGTTVAVSDSTQAGVGALLLCGTERMLVTDRAMITTGQAQQGAGAGTAVNSDVSLTVTDGTKYAAGEVLLLDSERMLVVDIAGNVLTVKRAWDGSVLATHSAAVIFAPRSLTVIRGALGTTAATHLISSAVSRFTYPGLVTELNVAEAVNTLLQETSGYSRTVGEGDNLRLASGAGLKDIRARAMSAHGRAKVRQRTT